ncbi:MAG: hypothetical protein ICV68_18500 [Pyrinomonadaceae bacterium]|nr:hypothetical protein [Pyrinomonadaceae bacterium]
MDWDVKGTPYSLGYFRELEPREVLYDFDGPRIFTALSSMEDELLVYLSDQDEQLSRYVVVPVDRPLVNMLREGLVTVREALTQPWAWLVDQTHEGRVARALKIDVRRMPADALPRPGTLLLASMRPLLSVRMVGRGLLAGHVPASVIRRAVDGATSALKALAEWTLQVTRSDGRPSDWLRRYYDLPAQRIAFASFEIAFAAPAAAQQGHLFEEERAIDQMGKLFQTGLRWAEKPGEELPSNETSRVALEALAKLTPPRHGIVTEVHVGGRLVDIPGRPYVLTRESSERVHRALRRLNADVVSVKHTGLIREFDKDKLTFILRDPLGKDIARCSFTDPLYDDAFAAFDSDEIVTVLGHESLSRGVVDVLSIGPEPRNIAG